MTLPRHYGLCLALLATTLVGGCGIKPGSLQPPPDAKNGEAFPHEYPRPETVKK